jgi:hypothetical protein
VVEDLSWCGYCGSRSGRGLGRDFGVVMECVVGVKDDKTRGWEMEQELCSRRIM